MWKVDPKTGVVATAKTTKRYEAADALIAGRAQLNKRSVQNSESVAREPETSNDVFLKSS